MHHRHRGRRGNRSRAWDAENRRWVVSARVERFFEPAVLLALRDGPAHGYELVEVMQTWGDDYVVDSGNLYRMLRALEDEGLVQSTWTDSDRGAARRIYALEPKGARVLEAWAEALTATEATLHRFRSAFEAADEDAQEAS